MKTEELLTKSNPEALKKHNVIAKTRQYNIFERWLLNFGTYKIASKISFSGKHKLDQKIWDEGAIVRVFHKYFLLYYEKTDRYNGRYKKNEMRKI